MVRFYFAVLIRHILRLSTVEIQPIKPKAKMKKTRPQKVIWGCHNPLTIQSRVTVDDEKKRDVYERQTIK